MGLKTTHIAFVVFCVIFFLATFWLSLQEYLASGARDMLFIAISSIISGAVLVPYSFHFMRKLKGIGYM